MDSPRLHRLSELCLISWVHYMNLRSSKVKGTLVGSQAGNFSFLYEGVIPNLSFVQPVLLLWIKLQRLTWFCRSLWYIGSSITQWAAVTTLSGDMIEPPQKAIRSCLYRNEICHGMLFLFASSPPTIRTCLSDFGISAKKIEKLKRLSNSHQKSRIYTKFTQPLINCLRASGVKSAAKLSS